MKNETSERRNMKPLKRKYGVGITLTNGEIDQVEAVRSMGYGNKEIFMAGVESLRAKHDVLADAKQDIIDENDPDYQQQCALRRKGK